MDIFTHAGFADYAQTPVSTTGLYIIVTSGTVVRDNQDKSILKHLFRSRSTNCLNETIRIEELINVFSTKWFEKGVEFTFGQAMLYVFILIPY